MEFLHVRKICKKISDEEISITAGKIAERSLGSVSNLTHVKSLMNDLSVNVCWEVKEMPQVQELYGQTDGEDNAYGRMYTHAQAEVAYIAID